MPVGHGARGGADRLHAELGTLNISAEVTRARIGFVIRAARARLA
jgi:hypothetical protein